MINWTVRQNKVKLSSLHECELSASFVMSHPELSKKKNCGLKLVSKVSAQTAIRQTEFPDRSLNMDESVVRSLALNTTHFCLRKETNVWQILVRTALA